MTNWEIARRISLIFGMAFFIFWITGLASCSQPSDKLLIGGSEGEAYRDNNG